MDYEIAKWTIDEALRLGADAVHAELLCFDNLQIQTEGCEIATLQQNRSRGLSVQLYVDQRFGTFNTNSLEPEAIRQLIRTSMASTRLLAPDPDRQLPDPARCYHAASAEEAWREALSLGNYHDDIFAHAPKPTDMAIGMARRIVGADERIINVSAMIAGRSGWQYMANSQGFEGFGCCSSCCAYTSVNLYDDDGSRPSDGWIDYTLDLCEMNPLLDNHCRQALLAAQNKIGAHPLEPGQYTIAIEPICLMKMLDPVITAMYGGQLYQHRSFLEGKLGETIFSPTLSLSEDPQHYGAFGASLFGADGSAAKPYDLISEGKVCTWLIGPYYARKMHCQPTLNTTSVLCLQPGLRTRMQIMESEEEVLLITGFLGGNSNEVTGDFSFGIEGQLYRHGQRVQGVSGMNITGNFLDFWKQLAETSSDVEKIPDGYFPLTLFKEITLN